MNRKLKKLIKNPRLYFTDLVKKRLAKGTIPAKHLPWVKKVSGNHKYSVICAVYGVESYLEQFFASIENQTLDFVEHIELIMVDDGSLDSSASIIKKWVSKYPNNIKYVSKENGGQASARNLGVKSASHEWVSFIDPDDFVDMNYFAEVDRFLSTENDVDLVSCNFIFYLEDKDQFVDSHPMKYRFKEKKTVLSVDKMGKHVQLSVNSAFFRKKIIVEHALVMGEEIKPAFEDAHFVNKYLLLLEKGRIVGYIRDAKYYYRKRADNSSTLDGAWVNPLQYSDKLEKGSLDLLEFAEKTKGFVPEFIQRTVLYDYIWYVKYIVNHSEMLSLLSEEQRGEFLSLTRKIFSFIDVKTIDSFDLAGCWFFHKVGMISLFKGEDIPFQIVYVDGYDSVKRLVRLKYYFSGELPLETFQFDDKEVIPSYVKTRLHDYVGETFIQERIVWVSLDESSEFFNAKTGDVITRLSLRGRLHHNGVYVQGIINHFAKSELEADFPRSVRLLRAEVKKPTTIDLYHKSWLFMDRDTQADDNAEHLYRYVVKNYSDINAYFVLRNTSHDWSRLKEEGFRLIAFESHEHKLALLNADHVISSHADQYVVSLLENKWYSDLLNFKYTFLQHGVIHNDLSNWLNNRSIDVFVTTTVQEFDSIAGDVNRYKFSSKEVALTGLPRHDSLLSLNAEITTEKLIVIMPTWRLGIAGDTVGQGNDRDINDSFYSSDYAQAWKSFLHSSELKKQAEDQGFKIVFFPHANIYSYLDWFETPDYIEIISHDTEGSMQNLFCRAAIMITDYSSVAFEMAYLDKAIIYYQFDFDYVFGGGHLTSKGYYDYKRDGFGPVCMTEQELLSALTTLLTQDAKVEKEYLERIDNTFTLRDGECCQRVYDAIRRLNIYDDDDKQRRIAVEYAKKATDTKAWELASQRWESLYSKVDIDTSEMFEAGLNLAQSNRHEGKSDTAKVWLKCLDKSCSGGAGGDYSLALDLEWAKLLMIDFEWEGALVHLDKVIPNLEGEGRFNAAMCKIECLAYLERIVDIERVLENLRDHELLDHEDYLVSGWELALRNKWNEALEKWEEALEKWGDNLSLHQVILLANMRLKKPVKVFETVSAIKKITNDSKPVLLDSRVEFSQVLHIGLVEEWGVVFEEMSATDMAFLIKAHRANDQVQEAKELLGEAFKYHPKHRELRMEMAKIYSLEGDLDRSVEQWESLLKDYGDDSLVYNLAGVYSKTGLFDKALDLLFDASGSIIVRPSTGSDWELLASLARHFKGEEVTLRALSNAE